MLNSESKLCPCKSGEIFSKCCGPLLAGQKSAIVPEELMRSRYAAYVERDINYLLSTWHPSAGVEEINKATIPNWCDLKIVGTSGGGLGDDNGVVEFKAYFLSNNKKMVLHEISRFVKEGGKWFYLDGDIVDDRSAAKGEVVGRNNPCPCGSGKKFKKCCGP